MSVFILWQGFLVSQLRAVCGSCGHVVVKWGIIRRSQAFELLSSHTSLSSSIHCLPTSPPCVLDMLHLLSFYNVTWSSALICI